MRKLKPWGLVLIGATVIWLLAGSYFFADQATRSFARDGLANLEACMDEAGTIDEEQDCRELWMAYSETDISVWPDAMLMALVIAAGAWLLIGIGYFVSRRRQGGGASPG